jgi:hypothetical protein
VRTQQSTALRTAVAAAVPVGLVLSAAVVWQSTSAAFTATTENPGNSWQAGSVVLDDSARDVALFDPTNDGAIKPEVPRSRCLRVDYTGSLPADIRLSVTTPAGAVTTTLDPYLVMSVEQGRNVTATTPVDVGCSDFPSAATPTFVYNTTSAGDASAVQSKTMSDLKTHATYATGLPVGTAVPKDTSLTFRITYQVKNENPAQGTSTKATFTWEAQSN